jgi:uncharacterized protein (DUF427 family)
VQIGAGHIEPTAKRIRAVLGGVVALDSTNVSLVWEHPYYPQYYVPVQDVAASLEPVGRWEDAPGDFGSAELYDVVSNDVSSRRAAWTFPEHADLADHVRFEWDSLEAWFEEDEVVFVHPRSPYTRIDTLRSSRDVRVELDGVTLAHSTRPTLLFETGLPTRHYLPATDVRLDLLVPSQTETACPYKGEASYSSAEVNGVVHEDLVWSYRAPLRESAAIAGMLCFFDERVDLTVDGVRQRRPVTKFS